MEHSRHDEQAIPEFPLPRIIVSRCFGFAHCRYDGQCLHNDFVTQLAGHAEMIPVCPEMECGLGVPRPPIRLYEEEGRVRVAQPSTGEDVTARLCRFIDAFLDGLAPVDAAILKAKSPSCGIRDAKVYHNPERPAMLRKGSGIFAAALLDRNPEAAVEDELRLTNQILREHFLIKAYCLARFRLISQQPRIGTLVEFHGANKLLFLAYNQARFRAAGRIVANHDRLPAPSVFAAYRSELTAILGQPFRIPGMVNSLYHAMGWISEGMNGAERRHAVDAIEEYRDERLPLQAVTRLIEAQALRFDNRYLLGQTLLQPFPRQLIRLHDSGRGRAVA